MASSLIHLAVAKKVNEVINVDNEKQYLLGSVAPDIAKMIGSTRKVSHFILENEESDTPNIERFLNKYKKYLNNPYELGYYVHLLTDVLWFDEFLPNFVRDGCIVSRSGELLYFEENELLDILYNDYTNLNPEILSYYNFDLSLFYEPFDFPNNHIEEISSDYFQDIIDKLGIICKNESSVSYVLQLEKMIHFIEYATVYVLDELKRTL